MNFLEVIGFVYMLISFGVLDSVVGIFICFSDCTTWVFLFISSSIFSRSFYFTVRKCYWSINFIQFSFYWCVKAKVLLMYFHQISPHQSMICWFCFFTGDRTVMSPVTLAFDVGLQMSLRESKCSSLCDFVDIFNTSW